MEQAHARLDAIEPYLDALPTYWLGNTTSEAMERQFKLNNLGLFCYSPEAGAAVRVMLGKYTKGEAADLDLYLSGYSVEPWRSDRIGRGVCQIKPCLSMLLMVQPSILRELMGNEEAFERGMTARTITFIVETEPLEDDGIIRRMNGETETAWSQLIRGILARREALAGNPHRITCTPEAREVFRQFHNEAVRLRRGEFRDIEAELGRWRENAIRLAVGQCVAENLAAQELTGEQAARAVEIMRWCARSALQITNAARMQKRAARADELQAVLAGKPGGKETLRNLDKSHGFKPEEVHTLGKTHLLHAIGQHWMQNREDFSFTYVSSTKFASEFAESIQTKRLDKFRQKYRHTGALLIDDIQLLAGKKRLQGEFLHTFNALLEAHKQIVVTCDRPVSGIQGLDPNLASCFESGLVTDVQPPDVEMRLTILKKKAQSMGVTLPDDIINFLAHRIRTNIRRLVGAVIRLASYASLTGKKLNVEVVECLLREILHEEGPCCLMEGAEINLDSVQIVTLQGGPFTWPPSALPKPALSQPRWSY